MLSYHSSTWHSLSMFCASIVMRKFIVARNLYENQNYTAKCTGLRILELSIFILKRHQIYFAYNYTKMVCAENIQEVTGTRCRAWATRVCLCSGLLCCCNVLSVKNNCWLPVLQTLTRIFSFFYKNMVFSASPKEESDLHMIHLVLGQPWIYR